MAEAKAEGAEGGEKPKSKKKLIFIVLGVVFLIAGIGVPMMLMGGEEHEEEHDEEIEEVKVLAIADLGQFIVNLSESSSFLKVHIKVEYDKGLLDAHMGEGHEGGGGGHGGGASGGGGEAAADAPHPHMVHRDVQIRDAIIRVLSAKKADELLTVDGKERLKEELMEALNEALALEEPPIQQVYFNEFIIQ